MKNLILFVTNKGIYVLAVFFLCSLQGCRCYYKAQTVKTVTAQEIKEYDSANKYIILHQDTMFWHLSRIEVNDESLAGILTVVPYGRRKYDITYAKGGHRYIREDRYNVLDQVHLYLQDSVFMAIDSSGHYKVALTDIKKIEVYQKDSSRTTLSWWIPLGLSGGLAVFILVKALTFSPLSVYGYSGN